MTYTLTGMGEAKLGPALHVLQVTEAGVNLGEPQTNVRLGDVRIVSYYGPDGTWELRICRPLTEAEIAGVHAIPGLTLTLGS